MATPRTEAEGFLGPTVDLLAAALGIGIVTYPLVENLLAVIGTTVPGPGAVTLVVAVGGSYPFVAGPWSLGRLGDYVLAWIASVPVLSVAAFPLAVAVGGVPDALVAPLWAVLFVLAHAIAVLAVGVFDLAPTRWV
jgi:hypothetical protein